MISVHILSHEGKNSNIFNTLEIQNTLNSAHTLILLKISGLQVTLKPQNWTLCNFTMLNRYTMFWRGHFFNGNHDTWTLLPRSTTLQIRFNNMVCLIHHWYPEDDLCILSVFISSTLFSVWTRNDLFWRGHFV